MTKQRASGTPECYDVLDMFLADMRVLDAGIEAPMQQQHKEASSEVATVKRERDETKHVEAEVASQTPRNNPRKKSSQTWFKRKQELGALRQQTQELETRVASLTQQHEKRRRRFPHGLPVLKIDSSLAATREKMRRKRVQDEKENSTLKRRVRAYALCISRLQAAVATASLNEQRTKPMVPMSPFEPAELLAAVGGCSFSTLEARVDLRFQDFPSILEHLRKTSAVIDQENVQIRCGDPGAAMMEYQLTRVLPFDGGKTYERVWSFVEKGGYPPKQVSKVLRYSDTTYGVESRSMLPLAGGSGSAIVDACTVVKRFMVPGNFVFLAESNAEYRGISSSWSFSTQESIWFAIRRVPLGAVPGCGSLQAFGCQMNAVVRSESVRQELPQGITPQLVLNSVRDHIDLQRQFLENTLWDSARTAKNQ